MENFICPCCGYKLIYSETIANIIFKIVCDYYGISIPKHHDDSIYRYSKPEKNTRLITAWFIRKITGEAFKNISAFFKFKNSCRAAQYCNDLQLQLQHDMVLAAQVQDLEIIITRTFEIEIKKQSLLN